MERKLSVAADGRLFRQGCRLAAAPLPAVMLLEGGEAGIEASAMSREAMQGALTSVSVVFGYTTKAPRLPEGVRDAALTVAFPVTMRLPLAATGGVMERKGSPGEVAPVAKPLATAPETVTLWASLLVSPARRSP